MNLNKENNKQNEVNVNEISNYLFKDFPDCLNAKELADKIGYPVMLKASAILSRISKDGFLLPFSKSQI